MSYQMEYFAWCHTAGSDKVWGYFNLGGEDRYSFWGKRGGNIMFKEHGARDHSALKRKAREKGGKGYKEVSIDAIEKVTPGFIEEFEEKFVLDKLFERFHGQG